MQKRSPSIQISLAIGNSAQLASTFQPASFDVIFIDGDHAYPAVKADILSWRSKLKPDGLLCGHDFTNKCGVEPAVTELCPGFKQVKDTSLWYWQRC